MLRNKLLFYFILAITLCQFSYAAERFVHSPVNTTSSSMNDMFDDDWTTFSNISGTAHFILTIPKDSINHINATVKYERINYSVSVMARNYTSGGYFHLLDDSASTLLNTTQLVFPHECIRNDGAIEILWYNIPYRAKTYMFGFNYSFTNSTINFIFLDEQTKNILQENISISFISENYAANFSINGTGNITIPLGSYDIIYNAMDYTKRYSYITLTNTSQNVTQYLLKTTYGTNVTIYVYDELSNPIENAYVYVQRYNIATNSYDTIAVKRSDFDGLANLDIELKSDYYKFLVYYDGVLKYESEKTEIKSSSIELTISLANIIQQDYFILNSISKLLSYDNSTYTFTFDYLDLTGSHVTQGCLEISRISGITESSYNSSCSSSSGSSISLGVLNISDVKYIAKAYITLNSARYLVDQAEISFPESNPFQKSNDGLLICLLFTLLACTLFLYDISTGLIILPIPLLIFSAIGWINLEISYAIGLEVICIVLAAFAGQKR